MNLPRTLVLGLSGNYRDANAPPRIFALENALDLIESAGFPRRWAFVAAHSSSPIPERLSHTPIGPDAPETNGKSNCSNHAKLPRKLDYTNHDADPAA